MTPETKGEIVLVVMAGAAALYLWLHNRNAGAGTGFEGFPALTHAGQPLDDAAPLFDIPAPVPLDPINYQGSPWALPAPGHYGLDAGSTSACNCAGSGETGSTFGSRNDMVAWLSGQPAVLAAANDSSNWY